MRTARNSLSSQKGLTLMELLVVLVILAILATSVIMLVLPNVMVRVRDTIRLSDLEIINRALLAYSTDKGYFPPAVSLGSSSWTCALTISSYGNCLYLQQDLKPYLSKTVFDPLDRVVEGGNTNCSLAPCYMYGTSPENHSDYCICAGLEGTPPQGKSNFCSNLVSYGNYCLTNRAD